MDIAPTESSQEHAARHTEGSVSFVYNTNLVFFNPTQIFNRDISILAVDQYLRHIYTKVDNKHAIIMDCLSASGLRALRYSQELLTQTPIHIIANDMSEVATRTISENLRQNPPRDASVLFDISCMDANRALLESCFSHRHIDVIDIDPYGHPTPFLPAALDACSHNGLLCVTATDGAITCRKQCKECFIRYDAAPASGKAWAHEGSIRIVLAGIAKEAAKRRASIEPLLSFFHKHYLRVFVLVNKKNKCRALDMYRNMGTVYHCIVCSYFTIQRTDDEKLSLHSAPNCLCPYCSSALHISGPMWLGELHSLDFLEKMLAALPSYTTLHSIDDIHAHLSFSQGEVGMPPLLYSINTITSYLKSLSLSTVHLANVLEQMNYRTGPCHTCPGGLKTDAPFSVILGILYPWHRICVLRGLSKDVQTLNLRSILPTSITYETFSNLTKRYFTLDDDEQAILWEKYQKDMDSLYVVHGNTERQIINYFNTSLHAQQWFTRSWKDLNGLINYRVANFKPNPLPNWGPKKAR